MTDDWSEHPEAQEWLRSVREDLVPKLQDSGATVSLVPEGETDAKFAVELGMSIMLDKPIILCVRPGTRIPDRLVRVADEIVEGSLDAPETHARLREAMERVLPDE